MVARHSGSWWALLAFLHLVSGQTPPPVGCPQFPLIKTTSVVVQWQQVNASSYIVRATVDINNFNAGIPAQTAPLTLEPLLPGTTYYVRVDSVSLSGAFSPGCVNNATLPPDVPDPVVIVTVRDITASSGLVQWTIPRNNGRPLRDFLLRVNFTAGTMGVPVAASASSTAGAQASFTLGALNEATAYTVEVFARNDLGISAAPATAVKFATERHPVLSNDRNGWIVWLLVGISGLVVILIVAIICVCIRRKGCKRCRRGAEASDDHGAMPARRCCARRGSDTEGPTTWDANTVRSPHGTRSRKNGSGSSNDVHLSEGADIRWGSSQEGITPRGQTRDWVVTEGVWRSQPAGGDLGDGAGGNANGPALFGDLGEGDATEVFRDAPVPLGKTYRGVQEGIGGPESTEETGETSSDEFATKAMPKFRINTKKKQSHKGAAPALVAPPGGFPPPQRFKDPRAVGLPPLATGGRGRVNSRGASAVSEISATALAGAPDAGRNGAGPSSGTPASAVPHGAEPVGATTIGDRTPHSAKTLGPPFPAQPTTVANGASEASEDSARGRSAKGDRRPLTGVPPSPARGARRPSVQERRISDKDASRGDTVSAFDGSLSVRPGNEASWRSECSEGEETALMRTRTIPADAGPPPQSQTPRSARDGTGRSPRKLSSTLRGGSARVITGDAAPLMADGAGAEASEDSATRDVGSLSRHFASGPAWDAGGEGGGEGGAFSGGGGEVTFVDGSAFGGGFGGDGGWAGGALKAVSWKGQWIDPGPMSVACTPMRGRFAVRETLDVLVVGETPAASTLTGEVHVALEGGDANAASFRFVASSLPAKCEPLDEACAGPDEEGGFTVFMGTRRDATLIRYQFSHITPPLLLRLRINPTGSSPDSTTVVIQYVTHSSLADTLPSVAFSICELNLPDGVVPELKPAAGAWDPGARKVTWVVAAIPPGGKGAVAVRFRGAEPEGQHATATVRFSCEGFLLSPVILTLPDVGDIEWSDVSFSADASFRAALA